MRLYTVVELWNRYIALANDFDETKGQLRRRTFDSPDEILNLIRRSLGNPAEKDAALNFVRSLRPEAQLELFDALLPLAAELDIGSINRAEQIILSFPREWVREKLRQSIGPFLDDVDLITPELLNLYFEVDRTMSYQLAERAATSDDPGRRDLGQFFLQKLAQEPTNSE